MKPKICEMCGATIQEHYACNSTQGFSQNDPTDEVNCYHNKLNCAIVDNAFAQSGI